MRQFRRIFNRFVRAGINRDAAFLLALAATTR